MSMFHAVVHIDHHTARILQFDADEVETATVKAHPHPTHQRNSEVRTLHEFYAEVCEALGPIREILVTGAHRAQGDFHHYIEKHQPQLARQIIDWQTVDHPSEAQLLAQARRYFANRNGVPGASKPG